MRKSFKLVPGKNPERNVGLTFRMQPIPEAPIIEAPVAQIAPKIIGVGGDEEGFVTGGMDYQYIYAPSETIPVLLSLSQYIDGAVSWSISPSGYAGKLQAHIDVVDKFPQFAFVFVSTVDGSTWGPGDSATFVIDAKLGGFTTEKFIVSCRA